MKLHRLTTLSTILICTLLIFMIAIGAEGKALRPKQTIFIFEKDTKLPTDANHYFDGVISNQRMKLNLSSVDIHTPGIYQVHATQASQDYSFQIEIK